MNKQEYLIKKGIIPDPSNGIMFIVYSSPEVVDMIQLPIWRAEKFGLEKMMRYHFHEAPYEMDVVLDEGYGTGIGDLWSWTYWCSLNENLAKTYFEEEKKRVKEKYSNERC